MGNWVTDTDQQPVNLDHCKTFYTENRKLIKHNNSMFAVESWEDYSDIFTIVFIICGKLNSGGYTIVWEYDTKESRDSVYSKVILKSLLN